MLVYCFEAVIITVMASKISDKFYKKDGNFWGNHYFVILLIAYQAGSSISRSSAACLKVQRIAFFVLFQVINFGIWCFVAFYYDLSYYFQLPLMVWTGI